MRLSGEPDMNGNGPPFRQSERTSALLDLRPQVCASSRGGKAEIRIPFGPRPERPAQIRWVICQRSAIAPARCAGSQNAFLPGCADCPKPISLIGQAMLTIRPMLLKVHCDDHPLASTLGHCVFYDT
jgi:hypothetical protein